jgi:hypothetical protein
MYNILRTIPGSLVYYVSATLRPFHSTHDRQHGTIWSKRVILCIRAKGFLGCDLSAFEGHKSSQRPPRITTSLPCRPQVFIGYCQASTPDTGSRANRFSKSPASKIHISGAMTGLHRHAEASIKPSAISTDYIYLSSSSSLLPSQDVKFCLTSRVCSDILMETMLVDVWRRTLDRYFRKREEENSYFP